MDGKEYYLRTHHSLYAAVSVISAEHGNATKAVCAGTRTQTRVTQYTELRKDAKILEKKRFRLKCTRQVGRVMIFVVFE